MKKFVGILTAIAVFTGCTFGDAFIDRRGAHNGLIAHLNDIAEAETNFFDEYYALGAGVDVAPFVASVGEFRAEYEELAAYVSDTKFGSTQQFYKTDFDETFGPYTEEYVTTAADFATTLEANGFDVEAQLSLTKTLDEYVVGFGDQYDAYAVKVDENAGVY